MVSSQLTGLVTLRLGIPLEATMDRRDGPTNIQLAGKGATMGAPQDTMLPFHGGTVFPPGMAGGKTAGADNFRRVICGRRVCLYIQNAHGLVFIVAEGRDPQGTGIGGAFLDRICCSRLLGCSKGREYRASCDMRF